jgi:hypothetical protein
VVWAARVSKDEYKHHCPRCVCIGPMFGIANSAATLGMGLCTEGYTRLDDAVSFQNEYS